MKQKTGLYCLTDSPKSFDFSSFDFLIARAALRFCMVLLTLALERYSIFNLWKKKCKMKMRAAHSRNVKVFGNSHLYPYFYFDYLKIHTAKFS